MWEGLAEKKESIGLAMGGVGGCAKQGIFKSYLEKIHGSDSEKVKRKISSAMSGGRGEGCEVGEYNG